MPLKEVILLGKFQAKNGNEHFEHIPKRAYSKKCKLYLGHIPNEANSKMSKLEKELKLVFSSFCCLFVDVLLICCS
jgi:hypothetical protein